MIKPFVIIFCCIAFSLSVNAQSFIRLSSGISKDINDNKNESFYHIPINLQWKPLRAQHLLYLLAELNVGIPISGSSSGTAFTLNPTLPASITVKEQVRPFIFTPSAGIGVNIYIDKERDNILYINVLVGICSQTFNVKYKGYDKDNYTIQNTDVNASFGSAVIIGEVAYKFYNNIFLQLRAQSPLADESTGTYPLSYKDLAPLQFTVGYNFNYNKKNKESKSKRRTSYAN